ncbi:hypothetical protein [Mycobacterium riyadhense]|uniref:Rv1733c family protein n=1 Tax=Mycobacterium riyadhense TaxID=486698 RepID=UPI00194FC2ED|nr:hypothetical protein [Mycobacterium riyadhense]
MQTFTLDPRRWLLARIVGRNPLLRRTDRIEALAILLALVMSLLAVPVAGVVGAVAYEARYQLYDQEAQARRPVTATVMNAATTLDGDGNHTVVQAKWVAAVGERSGLFEHREPVNPGENAEVWVDIHGNLALPPTPTWHAVGDAVATALLTLLIIGLAITLVHVVVRSRLDRLRDAQWGHEIARLQEHGGRANWH